MRKKKTWAKECFYVRVTIVSDFLNLSTSETRKFHTQIQWQRMMMMMTSERKDDDFWREKTERNGCVWASDGVGRPAQLLLSPSFSQVFLHPAVFVSRRLSGESDGERREGWEEKVRERRDESQIGRERKVKVWVERRIM